MSGVVDLADAAFLRRVDEPDAVRLLAHGLAGLGLASTGDGPPTVIGCPSAWGRPRRGRLDRALAAVLGPVPVLPRAILIAASHCDAVAASCVVVEALPIPGEPPETPPAVWGAHLLARTAGEWRIVAACAGELGDPDAGAALVDLAGPADVVLIDGPAAGELLAEVGGALPDVRRARVDRGLVRRHGELALPRTEGFGFAAPPESAGAPWPRLLLIVTAVVVLALGAAGVVARWPRPAPVAATGSADVGPVHLAIPADWHRTELADERPDDGRGLRAVFADAGDGRRLIVVVTALRAGATRTSVAESLRNRIIQRGDDVVVEFSAEATYGGRPVISYREAPASGAAIAWYVLVDGVTQISVGCQPGTGAAPIEEPCRGAVASVSVAG